MPTPNQKRLGSTVLTAVLLIGASIYFFTRPRATRVPSPAPSAAAVAPPKAVAAPPPSVAAALPAAPASAADLTVETLGPKGFAEIAQLAQSEGYFDAEGLKVGIERAKIATDLAHDVSTHQAAFGITFDFSIAFEAAGKHGFVLLGQVAHADRPIAVYARKGGGIASAADLKGKRVGVQPFPNSHYYLGLYLKRHGLTEADVTVVDETHPQVPGALTRGDIDVVVDCIAELRGFPWNLKKTPGLEVVDLSEPGLCPIKLGLIASDELTAKSPEVVERFTRAITKSVAFLNEHHDKAVDDIAEAVAIEGAKARALTDTLTYEVSLEPTFLTMLEAQARWFQATRPDKTGDPAPSYAGLAYPTALRKVLPASVTLP